MKFKAIFSAGTVLAVALLATSCGTTQQEPVLDSYATGPSADLRLTKAVEEAAKAQTDFARVQIARTKPAPLPLDESALPEELKRPASIEWSGPAHEAARRVAALTGYSFQITGNPPSIPPVVHVSMKDVPAAKALENIGLQAFPFGEVSVDPNMKRIEFRYLQAQQQPISARGTSPSWGK